MAFFCWDETKRQKNLRKRKLDFADARSVFEDDQALSAPDSRYSDDRWLLIGKLGKKLIVIAFTEPRPEIYRIISMRHATKNEARRYEIEKQHRIPSYSDLVMKLLEQIKQESDDLTQ